MTGVCLCVCSHAGVLKGFSAHRITAVAVADNDDDEGDLTVFPPPSPLRALLSGKFNEASKQPVFSSR